MTQLEILNKIVKMNDNFGSLKLLLDSDISTHPRCKHGPTLLFSRHMGGTNGVVKNFYACSAYRNRKDCDFYREAGDKVDQARLFRLVVVILTCLICKLVILGKVRLTSCSRELMIISTV